MMVVLLVVVAVGGGSVVTSTEPESAADPFFSGGATEIRSSQTLPTGVLVSIFGRMTSLEMVRLAFMRRIV